MENADLVQPKREKPKEIKDITPVDVLGAALPEIIPGDRIPPEESHKAPVKMPGAGNLKDIVGGPAGVVKGIAMDNAKQILGAQPLSSGDQRVYLADIIEAAAVSVVLRRFGPGFRLVDFPLLDQGDQYALLQLIRDTPRLQASLAATAQGSTFLAQHGIQVSGATAIAAASTSIARAVAAQKDGGTIGWRRPSDRAAASVVAGILDLEAMLAANPGDP